jgi:hypothetical protein
VAEPLIGTRLVVALGVNQAQHAEDFIDHEVRVLVMHLVADHHPSDRSVFCDSIKHRAEHRAIRGSCGTRRRRNRPQLGMRIRAR